MPLIPPPPPPKVVQARPASFNFVVRTKTSFKPPPAQPVSSDASTVIIQLGRIGDIINILPLAQHIAERDGVVPDFMVGKEFAAVLDGVSYINPVIWEGHTWAIKDAIALCESRYKNVINAQIGGINFKIERKTESYNKDSWRIAGFLDLFDKLPLNFDRRNEERERLLVNKHLYGLKKPITLLATRGYTSPFRGAPALRDYLEKHCTGSVLCIDSIVAERIYDILGLMDAADLLIAIDSAHMHLAAASSVPVIALVSDMRGNWMSSTTRYEPLMRLCYDSVESHYDDILKAVNGTNKRRVMPVSSTAVDMERCIVQLGRIGDVINILPAARYIYESTGKKPAILAHKSASSVLDGVSYASKVTWNGEVHDAKGAEKWAKARFNVVHVAQLWGNADDTRTQAGFCRDQWARLGMIDHFNKIPLTFDRRDKVREYRLAHTIKTDKPLIVYNLIGISAPFQHGQMIRNLLSEFETSAELYDISHLKCERIYDLLALYDRAALVITVDTATLHLAKASLTPVISFVNDDDYKAAYPIKQEVLRLRHREVPSSIEAIRNAILQHTTRTACVQGPDAKTGHGVLANACKSAFRNSPEYGVASTNTRFDASIIVDCAQWSTPDKLRNQANGKPTLFFQVWETDQIDKTTTDVLNASDRVLTACKWNANAFRACGVHTPIDVVQLGVDTDVFKPHPLPPARPFVFGAAMKLENGGTRKNPKVIVDAFLKAFRNERDVRLVIKLTRDCSFQANDSRITIIKSDWPESKIAEFLAGIHCFISASGSEGWGYWLHQALCVGRPVITPNYSAVEEYFDAACCYPVKYSVSKADGHYARFPGNFARVNVDSMAEQMRRAYSDQGEFNRMASKASECGARFDMRRFADKLSSVVYGYAPTFCHVSTAFMPSDAESLGRINFALSLWDRQYQKARWQRRFIPDAAMPRIFEDGKRKVPYVKDLIGKALEGLRLDDVVVLTNTDVCPNPDVSEELIKAIPEHGACYSYRRNIDGCHDLKAEEIPTKTSVYAGLDFFAFTKEWWLDHGRNYPDMLFATEAWDYCMKFFMEARGAKMHKYLIYHQNHEFEAVRNAGSPSQLYNQKVGGEYLKSIGIGPYWETKIPPPNPE